MRLKQWLKNQAAAIAFSISSVEKNTFGQKGEQVANETTTTAEKGLGTLAHALKNKVVSQEVKNLRWRTYKVLAASDGLVSKFVGYDADGNPVMETKNKTPFNLEKVKVDEFDNYAVEMVVDNTNIYKGVEESVNNLREAETKVDITAEDYFTFNKLDNPINIYRETIPKFELESYTKKLVIRTINETEKLLEFYVSIYPDVDNRRSYLFLSDIKKAILEPRHSSILDIKSVAFITNNTLGAADFYAYEFEINSFDKIIEFNGHYVIKFKATVTLNGQYIFEEFIEEELEGKYKRKEKKKK